MRDFKKKKNEQKKKHGNKGIKEKQTKSQPNWRLRPFIAISLKFRA